MIHEVNLYKPEFRPVRLQLSARRVGLGLCLLLAVCAASTLALDRLVGELQTERDRLAALAATLESDLAAKAAELAARRKDETLVRQKRALENDLERGRRFIALLQAQRIDAESRRRYSNVMRAFARQTKPGLWLESIVIDDDEFRFSGFVDSAGRMPDYLVGLGSDPVFAGQRFGAMEIRDAGGNGRLAFSLRSESPPGDGDVADVVAESLR